MAKDNKPSKDETPENKNTKPKLKQTDIANYIAKNKTSVEKNTQHVERLSDRVPAGKYRAHVTKVIGNSDKGGSKQTGTADSAAKNGASKEKGIKHVEQLPDNRSREASSEKYRAYVIGKVGKPDSRGKPLVEKGLPAKWESTSGNGGNDNGSKKNLPPNEKSNNDNNGSNDATGRSMASKKRGLPRGWEQGPDRNNNRPNR